MTDGLDKELEKMDREEKNGQMVSVIVPAYNAQNTISKSLKSILASSYENIEVIVVDDGSEDRTCEEVQRTGGTDSRVILLKGRHGGVSATRNTGMLKASGEYITFVDSDDWIDREMISALVSVIEKYPVDIAICDNYEVHRDKTLDAGHTGLAEMVFCGEKKDQFMRMFMRKNRIDYAPYFPMGQPWATLYRASLLREHGLCFREGMEYKEDVIFNLYATQYSRGVVRLDEPLYYYNKCNASSMTTALFRSKMIPRITLDFQERNRFISLCRPDDAEFREGLRQHIVKTVIHQVMPALQKEGRLSECRSFLSYALVKEAVDNVQTGELSRKEAAAVWMMRRHLVAPLYVGSRVLNA